MINLELKELLNKYPDDAEINIHVDGETSELRLNDAWIEHFSEDKLILITMSVNNL